MSAPRGPLPDPNARRRNAPTIPTTNLPASGRKGAAPEVPAWITLGKAGLGWWAWAWSTPQAAGWGVGAGQEVFVARRAQLEDSLAAVRASGDAELPLVKECREMDDRLGLTPKGMAALRWKIVQDVDDLGAGNPPPAGASTVAGRRSHLATAG